MTIGYPISKVDALLLGRLAAPYTAAPAEAILKTADGSIALGDLMVLDTTVVDSSTYNYTTIKTPATARLATGIFCVVVDLLGNAGAANSFVKVLFYGDVSLNLAANSGVGAPFCAANAVKTGTTTLTDGAKLLGLTKTAATGVTRVYFDGFGVNSNDSSVTGLNEQTILARQMIVPPTTTPCSALTLTEAATNKNPIQVLLFDKDTIESAWFNWVPPKRWNNGTITYAVYWSHPAATAFKVSWRLAGVAVSNDDTADVALGTAVVVNDTGGTPDDVYVTATSTAVTIAGTPATADYIQFRLQRVATDAVEDTLDVDAQLRAVKIWYTASALIDD
jgi:hypothetical protein